MEESYIEIHCDSNTIPFQLLSVIKSLTIKSNDKFLNGNILSYKKPIDTVAFNILLKQFEFDHHIFRENKYYPVSIPIGLFVPSENKYLKCGNEIQIYLELIDINIKSVLFNISTNISNDITNNCYFWNVIPPQGMMSYDSVFVYKVNYIYDKEKIIELYPNALYYYRSSNILDLDKKSDDYIDNIYYISSNTPLEFNEELLDVILIASYIKY